MKNIVAFTFPCQAGFSIKLIYCITFGSVSSASCLLESIAIILQYLLN